MKNSILPKFILLASVLFAANTTMAQSEPSTSDPTPNEPAGSMATALSPKVDFGVLAGVSLGPEQVVLGGTAVVTGVFNKLPVELAAGALLGLGDNLKSYRAFGHATYNFNFQGTTIYPLGGLSFTRFDGSCGKFLGVELDCSGNGIGMDLGSGIKYNNFRFESWIGFGDITDFTFSATYMF